MAQSKTRVGGSGFTQFSFRGTTLAWLQTLQDTSPRSVAQYQAVQPMDAIRPVEIVTSRAVGEGTLSLTLYQLWNSEVWNQLPGFGRADSLLDILNTQATLGSLSCRKIIKVPGTSSYRAKNYLNCTITDANDGETIEIGTMTLPKSLTIVYTSFNIVSAG